MHAAHTDFLTTKPPSARLVKLADKIANLRDLAEFPPSDWPTYRRRDYFDWVAQVIAPIRGVHPQLEALFDVADARRPE